MAATKVNAFTHAHKHHSNKIMRFIGVCYAVLFCPSLFYHEAITFELVFFFSSHAFFSVYSSAIYDWLNQYYGNDGFFSTTFCYIDGYSLYIYIDFVVCRWYKCHIHVLFISDEWPMRNMYFVLCRLTPNTELRSVVLFIDIVHILDILS